jgi:hypothetical protein
MDRLSLATALVEVVRTIEGRRTIIVETPNGEDAHDVV